MTMWLNGIDSNGGWTHPFRSSVVFFLAQGFALIEVPLNGPVSYYK